MKKGLILILFFVIIQSIAQEHFTGINTSKRNGLLNGNLNPAELANMDLKFDISILNTSVNFSNNKLTFNDLLKGENLENKFFTGSEAANVRIDGIILGPGLAYKKGSWAFGLTSVANIKANLINVDVALGDAIQNGNLSNLITSNSIYSTENQRINATTWGEINLTSARKIIEIGNHKLSGGITLKFLFPGAYANFSADNLKGTIVNTLGNLELTNATANVNLAYSGILGKDFNQNSNFSDFFSQGIQGIGTDFGLTYTVKKTDSNAYKFNAGLSVRNFGSMTFKSDTNTSINYNLNVQNGESLDLNQFENVSSLEQLEGILSEPQNAQYFQKTKTSQNFKVKLPTTLNLYADYNIWNKWYITGSIVQKIVDDSKFNFATTQNTYTLIPKFSTQLIDVYAPQTINEISGYSSGLGFRLSGFFIGSSSIVTAILNNSKQADVYIGARIGF